jgi:hypothetical protein
MNLTLKTLFYWSLLEKYRDALLYEKSLKTDIYVVRFAFIALKNQIINSTDRAFYKNAQIYTPVRSGVIWRSDFEGQILTLKYLEGRCIFSKSIFFLNV